MATTTGHFSQGMPGLCTRDGYGAWFAVSPSADAGRTMYGHDLAMTAVACKLQPIFQERF
jgi:hypothetical protein